MIKFPLPKPPSPQQDDSVTVVQSIGTLSPSASARESSEKSLDYDSESESLIKGIDAYAPSASAKKTAKKGLPDLVQSLDKLALSASPKSAKGHPDSPQSKLSENHYPFVGGFNPELLALSVTPDIFCLPPLRAPQAYGVMPMAMPAPETGPQLSTTQYTPDSLGLDTPTKPTAALPSVATPTRPFSSESTVLPNTAKPLQDAVNALAHPSLNVTTPPRFRAVSVSVSALNAIPPRSRTVSVPPSPTTSSPGRNTVQCSAMTKAGKQCSRQVKLPATRSHLDLTPVLYCYQHKVITAQTGFYVRKAGDADRFVEFSHYIPTYLQVNTQLALRVEMEKAMSYADVPGYVYAFEIRDPKWPDVIQLKVGRAVNLVRRLDEWDKQCRSKEKILRGWWPGEDEEGGSLLKGNVEAGKPGPLCHRVERLAHLELEDLSLHAPYLLPGWPDEVRKPQLSARSAGTSRGPGKCPDCGVVHREIFTFRRVATGPYKGKEWHSIVKPVIEKWGRFIREYHGSIDE